MKKIITWVDPEGRYRVTSPAYDDLTKPAGESENETIARVLVKIRARYGLADSHVFHLVEDVDQRARLGDLGGNYFRYGALDKDARAGAWEIDADGRPKVNMTKARVIHADHIDLAKQRKARDLIEREFTGENVTAEKTALRAIDVKARITAAKTPKALEAVWPAELPQLP